MKKTLLLPLFFFTFSIFFTPHASAREYYNLVETPRASALGGAITAHTNNWESLHHNPAGLAKIEKTQSLAPEFVHIYASSNFPDFVEKVQDVQKEFDDGNPFPVNEFRKFDGDGLSAGASIFTFGYFSKLLTVGFNLASIHAGGRIEVPDDLSEARAYFRSTVDSFLSLASSYSFFKDHLRIGASFRPFHMRVGMDRGITDGKPLTDEEILDFDDGSKLFGMGWGIDLDVGVQANTPELDAGPVGFILHSGLSIQNIFENRFTQRMKEDSFTAKIPQELARANLGFAAEITGLGIFKPAVSVEVKDMLVQTDEFAERLVLAAELQIPLLSWVQVTAAIHHARGNLGGGLHSKVGPLNVSYINEAVNLGDGVGENVSRRHHLQLALLW